MTPSVVASRNETMKTAAPLRFSRVIERARSLQPQLEFEATTFADHIPVLSGNNPRPPALVLTRLSTYRSMFINDPNPGALQPIKDQPDRSRDTRQPISSLEGAEVTSGDSEDFRPENRPETGYRPDHLRMTMPTESLLDVALELGHLASIFMP